MKVKNDLLIFDQRPSLLRRRSIGSGRLRDEGLWGGGDCVTIPNSVCIEGYQIPQDCSNLKVRLNFFMDVFGINPASHKQSEIILSIAFVH